MTPQHPRYLLHRIQPASHRPSAPCVLARISVAHRRFTEAMLHYPRPAAVGFYFHLSHGSPSRERGGSGALGETASDRQRDGLQPAAPRLAPWASISTCPMEAPRGSEGAAGRWASPRVIGSGMALNPQPHGWVVQLSCCKSPEPGLIGICEPGDCLPACRMIRRGATLTRWTDSD